jgi:hypothetical protein
MVACNQQSGPRKRYHSGAKRVTVVSIGLEGPREIEVAPWECAVSKGRELIFADVELLCTE